MPSPRTRRLCHVVLTAALLLAGCSAQQQPAHPALAVVAQQHDALALSDALEALIDKGTDRPADRAYAYDVVRSYEGDTASYAFARAAITGRYVQQRGLLAANLAKDVEHWARRSRKLDPDFRDRAATRLLGTLYVIAPATLLEQGNSEIGLDLLEGLAEQHPDVLENHLRLAEAYIALNDPDPARPHLCFCLARQSALRGDDQRLLKLLVGDLAPLECSAGGAAR